MHHSLGKTWLAKVDEAHVVEFDGRSLKNIGRLYHYCCV